MAIFTAFTLVYIVATYIANIISILIYAVRTGLRDTGSSGLSHLRFMDSGILSCSDSTLHLRG
jgi:hypothetical protein